VPRYFLALFLIGLSAVLAACGSSADGRITAVGGRKARTVEAAAHIRRVLDLTSTRRDGLAFSRDINLFVRSPESR
jgi:hypothetical protein